MNIAAGTRLGPYEIVAHIGAGGMGEVWRARDTRLDRSVAIKVLPREFAGNANLKRRRRWRTGWRGDRCRWPMCFVTASRSPTDSIARIVRESSIAI